MREFDFRVKPVQINMPKIQLPEIPKFDFPDLNMPKQNEGIDFSKTSGAQEAFRARLQEYKHYKATNGSLNELQREDLKSVLDQMDQHGWLTPAEKAWRDSMA